MIPEPDGLFVAIEGGGDTDAVGLELIVFQKRPAQLPGADQYGEGTFAASKSDFQMLDQFGGLIAYLWSSCSADGAQILSNLNLTQREGLCDCGCGDWCFWANARCISSEFRILPP